MSEEKQIMPIQPIKADKHGRARFVPNRIVEKLLEVAPIDMNEIACMSFTNEEREQFAQLVGYSLSGFGELSYVSDEAYQAAEKMYLGVNELGSRNIALREQLDEIRKGLKIASAAAFKVHPDDLEV